MNATTTAVSAMSDIPGFLPIFVIALIGGTILFLTTTYYMKSKSYIRLRKLIQLMLKSFSYFCYGTAGLSFIGIIAGIGYWLTSTSSGKGSIKYLGIGIAAYILIALFGFIVKKFVEKIKKHEKEFKKLLTKSKTS